MCPAADGNVQRTDAEGIQEPESDVQSPLIQDDHEFCTACRGVSGRIRIYENSSPMMRPFGTRLTGRFVFVKYSV